MTDEVYSAGRRRRARPCPADDMSYFAQMQRGNSLPHRTWLQLNEKRHRMRLAWDAFFKDYDLMLCPGRGDGGLPARPEGPAPSSAPSWSTTRRCRWSTRSSGPATQASPSCRRRRRRSARPTDGLPIGVQIIGPQYGDYSTIAFAKLLEKEYRSFEPPPAYG